MDIMDPQTPPRTRKYLQFDCGDLHFRNSVTPLRGRLLFEFPHQWLEPDVTKMREIQRQMSDWVDQNLDKVSAGHCYTVMEETVSWIYFAMPPFEEDVNRKLLAFGKYTLMAWIHDSFDALKSREDYPEFLQWSQDMIKRLFQAHQDNHNNDSSNDPNDPNDLQEVKKETNGDTEIWRRILNEIERSGFAERHPCIRTYFRLCHEVARDLWQNWVTSAPQIEPFVKSYLRQYEHDTWLDLPPSRNLTNLSLRKTTRYYSVGGVPFVEFCNVLEGVHLTEEERHEQHLKRLKFLLIYQAAIVNDLFSLKKEVAKGEPDNLVLLLCQEKQLSLEQSVDKVIQKVDRMHEEAVEIYGFLVRRHSVQSPTFRWIRTLVHVTKHVLMLSLNSRRYGHDFQGKIISA